MQYSEADVKKPLKQARDDNTGPFGHFGEREQNELHQERTSYHRTGLIRKA